MTVLNKSSADGLHQGQPVVRRGAPSGRAKAAMLLVHGRGATAESILSLADVLAHPDVVCFAPQADGHTWYPHSFLAPIEQNEPGISSGIRAIRDILILIEDEGVSPDHCLLLGFSQGACLTAEFAARYPRRYGGIVAFSGGLIGTETIPGALAPEDKRFDYEGSLAGTPVFIGCSDVDPHIPVTRVHRTAEVFEALGGKVDKRIYRGMAHTVNDEEIQAVRILLHRLLQPSGD